MTLRRSPAATASQTTGLKFTGPKFTGLEAAAPSTVGLAPPSPSGGALEPDATRIVTAIRAALRRVLRELDVPAARACDLEAGLNLHKTLAWKIFRVAHGRDALLDAGRIPGNEGVELFLRAAARHGASDAALNAVRSGVNGYRALVDVHADDRSSLEVMLRSISEKGELPADLRSARRAAYRCASSMWGEQVRTRLLSAVYMPRGESTADIATIRGFVGLRRLRPDVALTLARTIEHDSDQPGARRVRVEPIEPEGVAGGVPLLRAFCASLPEVVADPMPDGNLLYRFVDGRVGNAASITAFTGDVRRDLSGALHRDDANTMNALLLTISRPTALAVIDMWFPPGLWNAAPTARSLSAIARDPLTAPPATWRPLPLSETAQRLGLGAEAGHLREVPEYSSVMASVFARLGWDAERCEVHRLRVEYPMMGTCLGLTVELPER